MNFVRNNWDKIAKEEFESYLDSIKETDEKKLNWTKRIYNTNMTVLGIKVPIIKKLAKEINKGNAISFLKLNLNSTFENLLINGCLIAKIKDFNLMKKYLDDYSKKIDNWALCDCLDFEINQKNKSNYFALSQEYIKSEFPYTRRIGVLIWFKFINDKEYLNIILDNIPFFKNETHYYVNMALAWFVCECFVKNREIGLFIFKNKMLNNFVNNKAIQKIKDSFRVSDEDKILLENFKIKNKMI